MIYYANLDEKLSKTRFERYKDEHTYKYILVRIEICNRVKKKHPQNTKEYKLLTTKKSLNDVDKKYLKDLLSR